MDFAGVPGKGIVFSYPSPAEDQPRTKAPAPPGKDTGMYVILLLRMKHLYNDIVMRMLRPLLIGFVGKDKKAEIFGPQTAASGGESLVLFPCPTRIQVAHERTADTPVDILSPWSPPRPRSHLYCPRWRCDFGGSRGFSVIPVPCCLSNSLCRIALLSRHARAWLNVQRGLRSPRWDREQPGTLVHSHPGRQSQCPCDIALCPPFPEREGPARGLL